MLNFLNKTIVTIKYAELFHKKSVLTLLCDVQQELWNVLGVSDVTLFTTLIIILNTDTQILSVCVRTCLCMYVCIYMYVCMQYLSTYMHVCLHYAFVWVSILIKCRPSLLDFFSLLALQPPLGVVFYSPLVGFSLLACEVS